MFNVLLKENIFLKKTMKQRKEKAEHGLSLVWKIGRVLELSIYLGS